MLKLDSHLIMRLEYHKMDDLKGQGGRVNQKRRTRATLVQAAVQLVEAGIVPTIPEAADHAGISRATAYRYFSNQERLLTEAMLERAMPGVDAVVESWGDESDASTRLDQLVETVLGVVIEHEATFRAMLRASLDPEIDASQTRGGRRLRWLERALEPALPELSEKTRAWLIPALTPYLGIEALVSLCDIADLDPEQAVATARAASNALLRSALAEHLNLRETSDNIP